MKYTESKKKFIDAWGTLGSSWGISRTMAQIHALLLICPGSMTTDDIIDELKISRGNVSMSLKSLIEWGIVFKEYIPGDRKEHFYTDKDIWQLASQVARERKRRELDPVIKMLEQIQNVNDKSAAKKDVDQFNSVSGDLLHFAKASDNVLNKFVNSNSNWFFKKFMKMIG